MTSREVLAVGVVAAPALGAALVALSPRRAVTAVATIVALFTCALALALAAVALPTPAPVRRRLDRGRCGRGTADRRHRSRRARERPRLARVPRHPHRTRGARAACADLLRVASLVLGDPARGPTRRQSRRRVAARRGHDRGVRGAGRLQRTPQGLEAGWKYLILTTLGLGFALLGIVLLAAGTPGGVLEALSWQALKTFDSGTNTALVAYILLLAGLAAKIGWAPVQLASGRTRGSSAPGLRPSSAAFQRCCWSRGARSSRSPRSSGPGRRRASSSVSVSSPSRSRSRSSGGRSRGSAFLPRASSTWASSRSASASRPARLAVSRPYRRPRDRQGARLLCRSAARTRASRRSAPSRASPAPNPSWERRWGVPRRACRPAALPALRERSPDPRWGFQAGRTWAAAATCCSRSASSVSPTR